ncbi:MAG: hypothetical protein V7K88_14960 [Nostoc sp.]
MVALFTPWRTSLNHLFIPPSPRDRYQGKLNAPVVLVKDGNCQCIHCG